MRRKHHPCPSPTAEQIVAEHDEHLEALRLTHAAGQAAVKDVRHVAHQVADDIHDVAEDADDVSKPISGASTDRRPHDPPRDGRDA